MRNSTSNCTICNIQIIGEYCTQCGQRNTNKNLTFLHVIKELISNIFNFERSGLATFWLIMKVPKLVIGNYWNGYRNYYSPPSKFIVYLLIVIGIHITKNDDLVLGLTFADTPKTFFIILPVLFTLSSYICFIKLKRTLIEHLTSIIYIFSTWGVVITLLFEVYLLTSPDFQYRYDFTPFIPVFSLMTLTVVWNSRVFTANATPLKIVFNAFLQLILFVVMLVSFTVLVVNYMGLEITT